MASLINRQIDGMQKQWAAYKDAPYGDEADNLYKIITLHIESMEEALGACRDQYSDDDEALESMFRYVQGKEMLRAKFLEELFSESEPNDFELAPRAESAAEMISMVQSSEESGEFYAESSVSGEMEYHDQVELVRDYYTKVLTEDMYKLGYYSTAEYGNRPSVRRREVMHKIGGHCLDIAKVGIGVVAGIAVAKKAKLL